MNDLTARVDAFLDELFRLEPVLATDTGMHAYDGRWPDASPAGEREYLAFVERWDRELRALDADALGPAGTIDRDFLLLELDALRFSTDELRELDWDALSWVYLLGGGLFGLVAREFAPLAERLASAAGRLEGMPALLAVARARLGATDSPRPIPVSRFHAETALRQLPGVGELIDDALRLASEAADDAAVAAVAPRLRSAADVAKAALEAFGTFLADVVIPAADGDGRLGPDLFAGKMRRTLKGAQPTPAEIVAQGEREYIAVRAEMVRLARELWPAWMGAAPQPTDDGEAVRAVIDAIGREHQPADAILDFCREELTRIETFCRDRGVVGLSEEPLSIEWTPVFLRASGGAMLIPPGPLDKGQKAFFAVTPVGEDWPTEQVESYLREDNDRMLRLLTIHEAVPGHYLQLAYANRCASLARVILWSGVFAEGWAVYVTQVMMDLGYGAEDAALMLVHWKFYLRAVTNSLIDVKLHTGAMTEAEAVDLMVRGGFQEEAEARAKWARARLTSTQLSTYFVGSMEMWRLERDRRLQLARAAGAAETVVPEPRLVGGLGETPGFDYRAHLEEVLSHGSPPIPIIRRLVLGEGA